MGAPAVVMNMFYTGLGIARSLGEQGVRVIGLTSRRGVYGNATRYARTALAPDSKSQPEALLGYLLKLGKDIGERSIIFPTRDHDVVFLDRFREELAPYFSPVIPDRSALGVCLNKWRTYVSACEAGVPAPKSWLIQERDDLERILPEITFPCVLKPVEAHHWRTAGNWALVGGRKAIVASSAGELLAEYATVRKAENRALVQEAIPGGDDQLLIFACYFDRESKLAAGFHVQKLVQIPERFGTGCVVQTVRRSELMAPTVRLLEKLHFTGIAEVEYKWDAATREYKLIEINPRAWDQHPLGKACGVDLIYLAYCEHAGLEPPAQRAYCVPQTWIAEDVFFMAVLRRVFKPGPDLRRLLHAARGKRIYAIWSLKDPAPFLLYVARTLAPELFRLAWRAASRSVRAMVGKAVVRQKPATHGTGLGKGDFYV